MGAALIDKKRQEFGFTYKAIWKSHIESCSRIRAMR